MSKINHIIKHFSYQACERIQLVKTIK